MKVVYFLSRDLKHVYDSVEVEEITSSLSQQFDNNYPHLKDKYVIRFKDKNAANLEERIKLRAVDNL